MTLDADTTFLQRRATGGCVDNQHITGIFETGTISCGGNSGDIAGVTAGTGLTGGGTTGTVTLNAEFVSGVPAGTWIEAAVEIKHHTRSIAYLQGDVYAGEKLLLSASGIWRIFETPMRNNG